MVRTVTTMALKPLAAAACLAALAACGEAGAAPGILQVIPAPASVEPAAGSFHIANGVAIVARDARAEPVARYLADLLDRTRGIRLRPTTTGDATGGIRLSLDAAAAGSPEAYTLEVSPGGVEIRAADPRGLFYGAVTLWQLATADGAATGPATIQALRIADGPRFAWRGLMLDSARHYQPPEFVRQLIDWMALHKLNVLHWHLTDDQGWRLEIRKYPELTRVGAWRKPAGAGNPPRYGGFYTQAEVRELVAYAASRFVTIVPEIEMPGHAQAAIASYPQLGTGGAPPVSPDWGVHDWLFNADESTLVFLENVLDEVIDLFPGEFVHVGGDEAVKDRWRASPRVQARIRELGLADEAALQGWFIARIGRFLDARGRRLIGWDEILEGGIPARAAVMSWRGTAGGIAAARAGHDVVMAPSPVLYLDHWQSDSPREPPGRPDIVSLADVYAFEPVPAELAPAEARRILGAQVNAWTEHMRLPGRVEHQVFPRAAALAEATWSPARRAQLGLLHGAARRAVRALSPARHPLRGLRLRAPLRARARGRRRRRRRTARDTVAAVPVRHDPPHARRQRARPGLRALRGAVRCGRRFPVARGRIRRRARAVRSRVAGGGRGGAPPAHGRRARALQRQPGAPARGRRAARRPIARSSTWTSSIPAGSGATWISRAAPRSRPPWARCLSISRSAATRRPSAAATRGPRTASSRSAPATAPASRWRASRSPRLPRPTASR